MASIVYVSSSTTDVITEIASTSEVIISNLQGPQGATGPTGPQGTPGGIASVVAPITNAGTETAAIIGINSSSANTANYVVQRDANKEFVAGAVTIDTTLTPTSAPGKLYWDGGGTVNLGLAGGNVSVALGENLVSYVTNAEATTLAVGEVVYVFGAAGDRPSVKRASNTSEATSSKTLGIVAESIGANQIGFVTTRGIINKINTSAFTAGQTVYLGATAGTITSTKPVAPNHLVTLGVVLRANAGNGEIYVSVQNGFELNEIHDVLITSAANGNFLVYDSATSLWKNQAISATAPVTYNAGTRTIAANAATTSASGVVQLSDSTSTTSSVLASTPTATKAAFDLATTANATANAAIPLAQKAAANGVATLDASGLVPTNQLPALAITNTFVVNSQAAMLALTAQPGDVAIRTDLSESYILTADPASTLANWQELLSPPDAVTSVDSRVGAVTLTDKYAQLATANTFTGGVQQITTASASTAGLIIKASASQTENLQVWQNSSATNLVGVGPTGGIFINRTTGSSTTALIMSTGATTSTGIRVDGVAGQTADLQAWRDSGGTVLSNVTASGGFETNGSLRFYTSSARSAWSTLTNTSGNLSFNYQFALTDRLSVTAGAAATIPMTVKGAASQTGDLTQWQDSSGNVLGRVLSTGRITNTAGFITSGVGLFGASSGGLATLTSYTAAAGTIGLAVRGAASQTANLTEWQISDGTSVARIDAIGGATFGTNASLGGMLSVQTPTASTVGLVVKGFTSQSSDLQRWVNVGGTTLAKMSFDGQLTAYAANATFVQGEAPASFPYFQFTGNSIELNTRTASYVGLKVKGSASQTGDLTQWTSSAGTVLARFNATGDLYSPTLSVNTSTYMNSRVQIVPAATTETGIVVRGITNQAADLTQFQTSTGSTLSSVNAAGTFVGNVQDSQLIQYGAEGSVLQNIPTRVHPAETLLKQAVWWIDSAHSGSSGQAIKNLGWGGSALDATAGSTTAADSNDPQYLAWDGINYVYTPGVALNYLSVPDSNNLDITGDIDLRWQGAMDDWSPTALSALVNKWNTGALSYNLSLGADARLYFYWSPDGTTSINKNSTVVVPFTDGTIGWVRVTMDVDNGASGNDIKFFTSTDGIVWTQLGATVTTAGVTSLFASTTPININAASFGNGQPTAGRVYRAQILSGIDGVPVLDCDTSVIASGSATSFTALTGQTVTINRSTSGRKTTVVTHPVWLFGTDDFMEVNNRWLERTTANYLYLPGVSSNFASTPDSAALDITGDLDLRVKVALDDWTPATNTVLMAKAQTLSNLTFQFAIATNGTLNLLLSNNGTSWGNSAASTVANGITDGTVKWVRATFDADNGAGGNDFKFFTSDDGTTWTQLGATVTNAGTFTIGTTDARLSIGASVFGTDSPARGKFFRAQVLNGIGGTVAFDANFETGITTNLPTTFTESSANAATVTINYSGTGYRSAGVIASTYVFPGNPNTFKLSAYSLLDFGAGEDFTVFTVSRKFGNPAADQRILMKWNLSGGYYATYTTTGTGAFNMSGGGSAGTAIALTAGTLNAIGSVRNVSTDTLTVTSGSTTNSANDGTTTTLANVNNLAIGRQNFDGSLYADMEFVSAAIFRRVLTAAEIATLNSYFQGRVA